MKSALLLLVQTGLAFGAGMPQPPEVLICHLSARHGCGKDDICIDSMVRSSEPIKLDIKHLSFESEEGSGQIVFHKELTSDGRHVLTLTSPPLGPTNMLFAADYKRAQIFKGEGESEDYTCS